MNEKLEKLICEMSTHLINSFNDFIEKSVEKGNLEKKESFSNIVSFIVSSHLASLYILMYKYSEGKSKKCRNYVFDFIVKIHNFMKSLEKEDNTLKFTPKKSESSNLH